jgi:hypothetical protein
MNRHLFWPFLLVAAFGLPILMTEDANDGRGSPIQDPQITKQTLNNPQFFFPVSSVQNANQMQLPTANALSPSAQASATWMDLNGQSNITLPGSQLGPDLSAIPMVFAPVSDFGEVFRFDATIDWVKSRWDRVSIFQAEPGITAYRCDFVSGVNRSDIHGCITYFFDRRQEVARISFRGWTGDAKTFTEFCKGRFSLVERSSNAVGLFTRANWSRTLGALILENPPVARHDNPNQSLAIFLEVCPPQGSTSISAEMQAAIEALK